MIPMLLVHHQFERIAMDHCRRGNWFVVTTVDYATIAILRHCPVQKLGFQGVLTVSPTQIIVLKLTHEVPMARHLE